MSSLKWFGRASFVIALVAIASLACTAAEDKKKDEKPDIHWVPTPQGVVDEMLKRAKVGKKDVVYDLGCGDGRIVLTAAKKHGCKAMGFDVQQEMIDKCETAKKKLDKDIQKLVTFQKKNVFDLDLSEATVVTLYLLPELNVKLIPQLKKLKNGSRIVSHAFDMRGVTPDKGYPITVKAKGDDGDERSCQVYIWTTPLKIEKERD
jgi:SAM-dependent methyltransferase